MPDKAAVTGDEEVIRLLSQLDGKLAKKALRPSLRKAAKDVILVGAKRNLQEQQEGGTGFLQKQLKVRAIKRSRVKLGVTVLLRNHKGPTEGFYGLFLEYGLTKTSPPRRHRGSGKSTGDLQPMPFLRPALYDNKHRIRRLVVKAIQTWIKTIRAGGEAKVANAAVRAL